MTYSEILGIILQISTLLGGAIALGTFWRNSGLKRAEWLYNLHAKFYESKNYKHIRHIIDYEPQPEFDSLRQSVMSSGNDDLAESFVDYLNFFEFIGSLWKLGQLNLKEIAMIFEYYLLRLDDHDFVRQFLEEQGFENLRALINKLKLQEKRYSQ